MLRRGADDARAADAVDCIACAEAAGATSAVHRRHVARLLPAACSLLFEPIDVPRTQACLNNHAQVLNYKTLLARKQRLTPTQQTNNTFMRASPHLALQWLL